MFQVHFEAVLNDTEHVHTVKVTNVSPVDVFYAWNFVRHDICFEGKDIDEGNIYYNTGVFYVSIITHGLTNRLTIKSEFN